MLHQPCLWDYQAVYGEVSYYPSFAVLAKLHILGSSLSYKTKYRLNSDTRRVENKIQCSRDIYHLLQITITAEQAGQTRWSSRFPAQCNECQSKIR